MTRKFYFRPANFTFDQQISLSIRKFYFRPAKLYFQPANPICGKYMQLSPRFSGAKGSHVGRVWNKIICNGFKLCIFKFIWDGSGVKLHNELSIEKLIFKILGEILA